MSVSNIVYSPTAYYPYILTLSITLTAGLQRIATLPKYAIAATLARRRISLGYTRYINTLDK